MAKDKEFELKYREEGRKRKEKRKEERKKNYAEKCERKRERSSLGGCSVCGEYPYCYCGDY